MPPRPALAPRRLPRLSAREVVPVVVFGVLFDGGLGDATGFPEREVRRVVLLGAFVGLALGLELFETLVGEFAVLLEGGHVEVDRAVGLVGVARLDERL